MEVSVKKETEKRFEKLLVISILISVFFSGSIYSQNKPIKGVVLDSITNNKIFNATVQVLNVNTNEIITYTFTNKNGEFGISLQNIDSYRIKINHLGFNSFSKIYKKTEDKFLTIRLTESSTELEEVVLTIENEFKIKKDTISFNLKKVRDSTENVLSDLIKKLPGFNIDENKKLSFQGQKIDKVLIEGNDFFGKKHEMATENIPANAIESIDLLTNFKDFDQIKNNKKGKIVLNISLHENYKGKIVGNLDSNYGVADKYLIHTNLFKFSKKGNIAFVSDFNNTGESAVNVLDYIEMKGGIESFIDDFDGSSGTYSIDDSKFPRYVLSNDNVDNRIVKFNSLNYSHQFSEKTKLNGYLVFDKTKQLESQLSEKEIFNTSLNSVLSENIDNSNDNFLINSFFKFINKPNEKQAIKYQLKLNLFELDDELLIENNSTENDFDVYKKEKNNGIGQSFNYKLYLSNYWRLNSTISYDYKKVEATEKIESNDSFLGLNFLDDDFTFFQNSDFREQIFSQGNNFFYEKNNKTSYEFALQYKNYNVLQKDDYREFTNFNSTIKKYINTFGSKIKINHRFSNKFNVSLGISPKLSTVKINNKKEEFSFLTPSLSIQYKLNNQNKLSFNYSRENYFIGNQYLYENQKIKDYQTVILRNDDFFTPILSENYRFKYSSFKQKRNRLLTINVSFSKNEDEISYNTLFNQNTIFKSIIRTNDQIWKASFDYSKPLFRLPFRNKFRVSLNQRTFKNQLNDQLNDVKSNNATINYTTFSKFRNSFLQLNFGFKYSFLETSNTFSELNFKTNTFESFINLNGKVSKKFNWDVGYEYLNLKTKNATNDINAVNFNLRYLNSSKKVQFHIKGNNILNINSNNSISQIYADSFNQSLVFKKLRGYILFGVKYDF